MQLAHILCRAFRWTSFPTFCALLAGGSAVLETTLRKTLAKLLQGNARGSHPQRLLLVRQSARFVAVLLSSWLCFPLLNSRRRPESQPNQIRTAQHPDAQLHSETSSTRKDDDSQQRPQAIDESAGRTLDLTLFAAARAVDILACVLWEQWTHHRKSRRKWTYLESILPQLGDASLFAASAAVVMWAWFYHPDRLPYSYGRWISEAAQVDSRLIEALRSCRRGHWAYGQPKGDFPVLESMCKDYGWPEEWGDSSKTVPFPCEVVHMGCGPSCEKHAVWRFAKSFTFACSMYFPLQLMLQWRSRSLRAYVNAAKAALRSSTFLGLFITLFYYSVCLARTRLGPRLFSAQRVTPTMWDSGLCVGAGCAMCGWSILAENPGKRREFGLFVAPRAAATLLPRRFDRKVCVCASRCLLF